MTSGLTPRRGISVFEDREEQLRLDLAMSAREGYGNWLSTLPWDHFGTFEYRRPRYLFEHAKEGFSKSVSRIQQRTQCKIGWCAVYEKHLSGALHIHALLQRTASLQPSELEAAWSNPGLHGRYYDRSLVEVYNPSRGATHYMTKFVAIGDAEIDVSPTLWGPDGKPIGTDPF